jgi:hypothetical protein
LAMRRCGTGETGSFPARCDICRQRVSCIGGFRHRRWHLDETWGRLRRDGLPLRALDKGVALKFMRQALKRHGSPETIATEGLRSYRAAMADPGWEEKQEVGARANNRVEISHPSLSIQSRSIVSRSLSTGICASALRASWDFEPCPRPASLTSARWNSAGLSNSRQQAAVRRQL